MNIKRVLWQAYLRVSILPIIFTIFFAIYVANINPDFLPQMLENWSSHYHVRVGIVVFVAAIMGFSTTFVLTLSFMQLFKESWNTKKKHDIQAET